MPGDGAEIAASFENAGGGRMLVYPQNYIGRMTASGRPYNPDRYVVSHPDLPAGTLVFLYAPASGKYTFAEVIDRSFVGEPQIIDVSRAVADQLGVGADGSDDVRIGVVGPFRGQ